jgi:hypothetical protein
MQTVQKALYRAGADAKLKYVVQELVNSVNAHHSNG